MFVCVGAVAALGGIFQLFHANERSKTEPILDLDSYLTDGSTEQDNPTTTTAQFPHTYYNIIYYHHHHHHTSTVL